MWLARFQHMDKENFVPYSKFKHDLLTPVVEKSTEEIIDMAERIKQADQQRFLKKEGES